RQCHWAQFDGARYWWKTPRDVAGAIAGNAARRGDLECRQSLPGLVLKNIQAAARPIGIDVQSLEIRSLDDLTNMMEKASQSRPDALVVIEDPLTSSLGKRIAILIAEQRLQAVYGVREGMIAFGGLISYGTSIPDLFRRAATYVHKILQGAKPADLPVEQPTKFELIINLKTTEALGLTVPPSLLVRADEVIE